MNKRRRTTSSASSGGVGVCGVLAIVFIVLKLTKLINWSWVWVLSPIWITLGLALIAFIVVFIVTVLKAYIKVRRRRKGEQ